MYPNISLNRITAGPQVLKFKKVEHQSFKTRREAEEIMVKLGGETDKVGSLVSELGTLNI